MRFLFKVCIYVHGFVNITLLDEKKTLIKHLNSLFNQFFIENYTKKRIEYVYT